MATSQKRKKNKRKLVEEAAERLAAILVMQIEGDEKENPNKNNDLNFKRGSIIPSQQNCDNEN